ncbi:28S ribosomal protein S11, mitochondrial isoform X2 [Daktulosphaira vitifoliae]|uniref:28S ribosomal protein S11, mitochondrial isoform X2 n=1 Tax=Daktulosphaira vitifoliae TaxID=58002 RepID=UPI0021AAE0EA|nr:28S ribosomal protein S11, mitochondrial isoform X2 [Daktulosphaira vitifoliae]
MFTRIISYFNKKLTSRYMIVSAKNQNVCQLCTSFPSFKNRDRRSFLASVPSIDEGTDGEKFISIDSIITKKEDMYPDDKTPDMLVGGIKFSELPICHIKSSKNNTILHLTKSNGERIMIRSCGMEGFKNTRKGTNIAAQATAIGLATSSIKGLTMGGLNIVSVTDDTPVSWTPLRARKRRKL